jgi:DNA ligase 1
MKPFKPMLAGSVDTAAELQLLKYPLSAEPKLDGIRAVFRNGKLWTRSLKLVPNRFIQAKCAELLQGIPETLDGELMLQPHHTFQDVVSAVMSEEDQPDFTYHIFDAVNEANPTDQFDLRRNKVIGENIVLFHGNQYIRCNPRFRAESPEAVLEFFAQCLEQGYEGVMLRSFSGPYKYGRATLREGYLLKYKEFLDAEATITGVYQRMRNDNAPTINELGLQERSSHQANMTPVEEIGGLQVRDVKTGLSFSIGSGFTQAERQNLWLSADSLIGKVVTYKYQPQGVDPRTGCPRFPIFVRFRESLDV